MFITKWKKILYGLAIVFLHMHTHGYALYFYNDIDSNKDVRLELQQQPSNRVHNFLKATIMIEPGQKKRFETQKSYCWHNVNMYYTWSDAKGEHEVKFNVTSESLDCNDNYAVFYHLGGGKYKILHGKKAKKYLQGKNINLADFQITDVTYNK